MEPNRTGGEAREKRHERQPDNRKMHANQEPGEDLEGQLGPDELPDAEEVTMNLEAKRHH